MEIIEQPDGQSCLLRLSKEEWLELGKERGYLTAERQQQITSPVSPATCPGSPTGDRLKARVEQERASAFAIYVAGDANAVGNPVYAEQLLCTLSLHQAALALKALFNDLIECLEQGRD